MGANATFWSRSGSRAVLRAAQRSHFAFGEDSGAAQPSSNIASACFHRECLFPAEVEVERVALFGDQDLTDRFEPAREQGLSGRHTGRLDRRGQTRRAADFVVAVHIIDIDRSEAELRLRTLRMPDFS